ncbi:serine hydrolase domain-containing protein [Sphingosinicella rhizophila]|uniref:Serine hydrolase domain-containing protein n=1 Tax=Sphingosinicella rhizophila TaxID=3050082 RepID=A0ABU3QAR2_9SPHN|nr:serine hydrolase domain-containing protein [Sphingosinicella sp. GR2756]MDT9600489.1 serine hydrolase domain-containing protein [Sphingosinicella sp. GR2756]
MKTKLLSCLLASALLSSPLQAADMDKVRQAIADPKGMAAPGCVAGAFRNGTTLFVTSSGAADIAAGKPLDGDTLFYAASVSKQFTALAVAILATRNKIDLDADVRKYLPDLPAYEVPVTVRMLLNMTSGIRDSLEVLRLAGVTDWSGTKKDTAVKLLYRQKETNFRPGTDYRYSNGAYLLLAELVERVSGMPFADFAKLSILKPLGMERSHFLNDHRPSVANVAHGYVLKDDIYEIRDTYPSFSGSGGLMLSVNDLARFDHDIAVGHKVWTPAVRKILLEPGKFADGKPVMIGDSGLAYAAGLMVGQRRGQYYVGHGGGAEAFRHMYARLPERGLGVAVFCNRADKDPQQQSDAVMNAVEANILAAPEAAGPTSAKPDGRYASEELMATYDIVTAGDQLTANVSSPFVTEATKFEFTRKGDKWEGAYGSALAFDSDGQGFTISSERAKAIRFRRMD